MSEIWSSYQRKLVIIKKAVPNSEVSRLLQLHYCLLHSKLVHSDSDLEVFNDTFLRLTYSYDNTKDFVLLYIYYFNLLKGAYYRADKVTNYYMELVDSFDENSLEIPDIEYYEDAPKPKTDKLSNLKNTVLNYAKHEYKRKPNLRK